MPLSQRPTSPPWKPSAGSMATLNPGRSKPGLPGSTNVDSASGSRALSGGLLMPGGRFSSTRTLGVLTSRISICVALTLPTQSWEERSSAAPIFAMQRSISRTCEMWISAPRGWTARASAGRVMTRTPDGRPDSIRTPAARSRYASSQRTRDPVFDELRGYDLGDIPRARRGARAWRRGCTGRLLLRRLRSLTRCGFCAYAL